MYSNENQYIIILNINNDIGPKNLVSFGLYMTVQAHQGLIGEKVSVI